MWKSALRPHQMRKFLKCFKIVKEFYMAIGGECPAFEQKMLENLVQLLRPMLMRMKHSRLLLWILILCRFTWMNGYFCISGKHWWHIGDFYILTVWKYLWTRLNATFDPNVSHDKLFVLLQINLKFCHGVLCVSVFASTSLFRALSHIIGTKSKNLVWNVIQNAHSNSFKQGS